MFSHYIQQCASGNSEYWFGLQGQSGKRVIDSGEKNEFRTFRKGS